MIDVTLIKMGIPNRDFTFDNDERATVEDLFERANEVFSEGSVTIGQSSVDGDYRLRDGDRVFVSKKTKGNVPWDVVIVRMGNGANVTLPAEDGYTVNQVLDQLPADQKDEFFGADKKPIYEYRLPDGNPIEGDSVLARPTEDTMKLMFTRRTKGN